MTLSAFGLEEAKDSVFTLHSYFTNSYMDVRSCIGGGQ